MNDSSQLQNSEIKARALRGVASTFSSHLYSLLFRLGLGVFLARRLTPDDFGLVAIVTAITGVFGILQDQGSTNVLVQSKQLDERGLASLFWFMGLVILVEVLVLAALAPAIAWFYRRPELTALTLVLLTGNVIAGMANIPLALLRRQMHFDRLARIQILSLTLSVPLVVAAAAAGWGYWALALYLLLPPFLTLIGAWASCDWSPRRFFAWASLRPLIVSGRRFLGLDLLTYGAQTADALVLGRVLAGPQFGLYQRTQSTRLLATNLTDSTLMPVLISSLSRLQDKPESFWKTYRTSVYAITALLAPCGLVLALAPGECLGYVFGAQWIPAAPVMRITAFLFLLHPLIRTTHAGLFALGRPERLYPWLILTAFLSLAGVLIGQRWGLPGVAAGVTLAQLIALPFGLGAFAAQLKTSRLTLIRPMLPLTLAALALAAVALPFARMAGPDSVAAWPRLAVALAACALLLLFIRFHLARSESGRVIVEALRSSAPPPIQTLLTRLFPACAPVSASP